jgi:hypothetical protein
VTVRDAALKRRDQDCIDGELHSASTIPALLRSTKRVRPKTAD